MSIKCKFGFHTWVGCKCSECGKISDEKHDRKQDCEKCSVCGTITPNLHNWSSDCEKCRTCGKTRENQHDWTKDCEKCSKCGTTRENQHDCTSDCEKCSKCGMKSQVKHDWTADCGICSECGAVRSSLFHDWTTYNGSCSICRKKLDLDSIESMVLTIKCTDKSEATKAAQTLVQFAVKDFSLVNAQWHEIKNAIEKYNKANHNDHQTHVDDPTQRLGSWDCTDRSDWGSTRTHHDSGLCVKLPPDLLNK
jgi:hypothetical protein